MNSLKSILTFIKNNPNNNIEKAPEGYCPNCWGRQEYGGNFYKAIKAESIKDLQRKKGWITSYAEKNLNGIRLQGKQGRFMCNVCFENYDQ